jgi:hypothetical protein
VVVHSSNSSEPPFSFTVHKYAVFLWLFIHPIPREACIVSGFIIEVGKNGKTPGPASAQPCDGARRGEAQQNERDVAHQRHARHPHPRRSGTRRSIKINIEIETGFSLDRRNGRNHLGTRRCFSYGSGGVNVHRHTSPPTPGRASRWVSRGRYASCPSRPRRR